MVLIGILKKLEKHSINKLLLIFNGHTTLFDSIYLIGAYATKG